MVVVGLLQVLKLLQLFTITITCDSFALVLLGVLFKFLSLCSAFTVHLQLFKSISRKHIVILVNRLLVLICLFFFVFWKENSSLLHILVIINFWLLEIFLFEEYYLGMFFWSLECFEEISSVRNFTHLSKWLSYRLFVLFSKTVLGCANSLLTRSSVELILFSICSKLCLLSEFVAELVII